jgi:hypothetical protein
VQRLGGGAGGRSSRQRRSRTRGRQHCGRPEHDGDSELQSADHNSWLSNARLVNEWHDEYAGSDAAGHDPECYAELANQNPECGTDNPERCT